MCADRRPLMADVKVNSKESTMRDCPICGANSSREVLRAPDRFHGRTQSYLLLRCPACSLVWLHDPPPPNEMSAHYGTDYDRAISGAGKDERYWTRRRDTLSRYKTGGAILDLGCSSGGFLATLKGPAWELFGIEMSERVAREAQARTGAHVFVGDILDAAFPPESFDAITCFQVFEHVYQPDEVMERVKSWLKPGGVFYAEMPNISSAGARIFGSYWYALELPRHLFHFSPESLRYLAHSAGLHEMSITTYRNVFLEDSLRYVLDDFLRTFGISPTPLAQAKPASLAWRVVRKGFRLTVLPVLSGLASFAGDGEVIRAVLTKR